MVPGDGRVACQHCYDRIRPGLDGSPVWVGMTTGEMCFNPAVDHKPMPTVRLVP